MAIEATLDEIGAVAPDAPAPLPLAVRWKILGYIGVLIILLGFGSPSGGLIGLPMSFFLKNRLHLKAHELAIFSLISHIPVYVAFLFGFARDRWNPFGMRDRGFIVLFGAVSAVTYSAFAFITPTYATLMAAYLMVATSFLFIGAALRGLMSTIAQQNVMTGQASAAWNIFEGLPALAALLIGGLLSDVMESDKAGGARLLFLTGAGVMTLVALYGFFRPASVFEHVRSERLTGVEPWSEVKRLLKHKAIYPALAIWMLWNFAPGSATPLQYYLQNTLHGKDAQWGQWNAIFGVSFVPTFLIFGLLCRRFPLKTLLLWGTIIGIPQFIPLLFVHSMAGAMLAAVPIGLMGGICSAAYWDLLIRSCPKGLQGTLFMTASALFAIDVRFGDLLGTTLYDRFGGFTVCVIAITVVYALILPTLLFIPKALIATRDGEALITD